VNLAALVSRRRFLLAGTTGLVVTAMAACSQAAPPAPATSAPATGAPTASGATGATAPTATSATASTAQATAQPASQVTPSTAKAATLTIWPRGATDQVVFEKIDAGFKTKHPEITVTLQPLPDNGYEKFLASVAANSGPDSLVVNTPAGVPMIYKGAFLSLQDYVKQSTDVQDNLKSFAKPALDSYTAKGQLYAIPVTNESQVIFYNADLLKKANLEPPENFEDDPQKWNWDTLVSYAKKLNQGTGFDRPVFGIRMLEPDVQGGWGNWVYSNGGAYISPDGSKCVLDSAESAKALQWMLDFRFKLDVSPGPEQLTAAQQTRVSFFQNQKVAIEPDGEYFRRYLYGPSSPKDGLKFTFGIAQYPFGPNGKRAQMFHTLGLPINKASKNADAMWEYLRHFSTQESQQFITDLWGSRGGHTGTYASFVAGGDKPKANWAAIVKADAYGVPLPISPYLTWQELYDPFTRVFGDLVMQGKLDPVQGIKQIVTEVQQSIDKNKAAG
jgi:ABC-type glycerol-3-phosphate transport system substrate-binding protein